MARKITISFKETKKDIELYDFINSLDDKSAEIKNILRTAFNNKLSYGSNVKIQKDNYPIENKVNVTDF